MPAATKYIANNMVSDVAGVCAFGATTPNGPPTGIIIGYRY